MRNNGLKLYQADRIKQAELTPVPVWQYLNGSSGLERLCQSGTLGLALDTNCSFVTDVARADCFSIEPILLCQFCKGCISPTTSKTEEEEA